MKSKIYEPVRVFEQQTGYCPLYLARHVVDEARDYFRMEVPESCARKLAQRAERVFAKQPFWQRKLRFRQSEPTRASREFILKFMRHWLSGVLARENPLLFRQLPESFKIGLPLPELPPGGAAAPPHQKRKTVGSPSGDGRMPRRCVQTKNGIQP
jgi:hypothetical protein